MTIGKVLVSWTDGTPRWLADPQPWDEETPVEFRPNHDTARLLLYQRCLDAGWTRAKATRYINRMVPSA